MKVRPVTIKKVVDSNIFIYSLLDNHPAHAECAAFLDANDEPGVLISLIDCIFEIYAILKNVYSIQIQDILIKIEGLLSSNVSFSTLNTQATMQTLELASTQGIQITDARLYLLASDVQAPVIMTDDIRFQNFIKERGLIAETPISQETRNIMEEWEAANLPARGLPRILAHVHEFLDKNDPSLALRFKEATDSFS
jgi:predicted nucleic acid-binding protein